MVVDVVLEIGLHSSDRCAAIRTDLGLGAELHSGIRSTRFARFARLEDCRTRCSEGGRVVLWKGLREAKDEQQWHEWSGVSWSSAHSRLPSLDLFF